MKSLLTTLAALCLVTGALAQPPNITSPPQSRALKVGDHIAFITSATGAATLKYQWSFNGVPIATATAPTLSLTSIQLTNAGTYTVTVTNAVGTNTASATLAVATTPWRFYPTNLVTLRAGDGVAALANSGNTYYFDQYTTGGVYVSSVMIPDSGSSSLIGFNSATDHYLDSATNNRALLWGGCNVTRPFSGGNMTTTAAACPRGVGTINGLGYYTLAFSDTLANLNSQFIRGVTSTDGQSQFWFTDGSTTAGVVYAIPGQPDAIINTSPAGRFMAAIYNNDLYVMLTGGLFHFNGLPNSATLPSQLAATSNPNDFALSPDGNTLYMADGSNLVTAGGGIQRWDLISGTWTRSYTFTNMPAGATGNNGPDGLAVDFSAFSGGGITGTGAVIYATTGQGTSNNIVTVVDNGPSTAPLKVLYTGQNNYVVRGLRFAPVADPPFITSQPADTTNLPGSTVTFSVGVTGSQPFSFFWQRGGTNLINGVNVSGANSTTLTLMNVSTADATSYTVVVSNAIGSVTSSNATLTLTSADPGIVIQPQPLFTNFGAAAVLSVRVVGSAPLTFQWLKDGVNLIDGPTGSGSSISGSGTSNLTVSAVSCADVGSYSLILTNSHGVSVSSNALLSVADPAIVQNPTNRLVAIGANVNMAVLAGGTPGVSYQWNKNGLPLTDGGEISGSSTATLSVTGAGSADAGDYNVTVMGGCGSNAVSTVANLTVVQGPQSRTVRVGDNVTFLVAEFGSQPLAYQWSYNGTPITSATNTILSLSAVQPTGAGTYSVMASNTSTAASVSLSASLVVSNGFLPFAPTNLVVLRAGDGGSALAATGNPLFLDQFTTNGVYVSTISIPTRGPTALIGGSGVTDSYMGISSNNHALVFGGYNGIVPFPTAIAATSAGTLPRGIASVNGYGYYSLAVSDTNPLFNGQRAIGVASTDGATQFWSEAGANGTLYITPGLGPDVQIATNATRFMMEVVGNDLYASLGGGIYHFGSLPTNATAPTQVVSSGNPNDFAVSPDGLTLYLTDGSNVGTGAGGLKRWDFDTNSLTWSLTYTIATPATGTGNNGPDGMTVDFSGFPGGGSTSVGAVIYVTTGEATQNQIVKVVDEGSGNQTITSLVLAGPNEVLRGIRFGPLTDTNQIIVAGMPSKAVAYPGRTLTVPITVVGAQPFTYQWQKDNTNLANNSRVSGAQTATLSISNAQSADLGSLQLFVTNAAGHAASSLAPVLLETRPTFNTDGSGWTLNANNGPLSIVGNVLTLTDGNGNEGRSAFFNYPMYIGGFSASFIYQDVNGLPNNADGATFCVQNSAAGASALGSSGGGLGYGGITNSVAVELNLFNGNGMGIAIRTNGVTGSPYISTLPLRLTNGNPISVSITYNGSFLNVSLVDTNAGTSFSTNVAVNIPLVCGSSTAYIGVTAATGGSSSTQTVSGFTFVPLPTLVAQTGINTVTLSWPASVGGFVLQSSPTLSPPNWQTDPATITVTGGQFQATVPSGPGAKFYRLNLP
jgi:sugar lactone lactonase YvrE